MGINTYGFGIAGSTLQYSSQGNHTFYNSANNATTFNIDLSGNVVCSGSLTSSGAIYANNGILTINAAEWTSGGSKGIVDMIHQIIIIIIVVF
jgi:hypothetical protein